MADTSLKNALNIIEMDVADFLLPTGGEKLIEYVNDMSDVGKTVLSKSLSEKDTTGLINMLYGTVTTFLNDDNHKNQTDNSILAMTLITTPLASRVLIAFVMRVLIGIVTTEEIR